MNGSAEDLMGNSVTVSNYGVTITADNPQFPMRPQQPQPVKTPISYGVMLIMMVIIPMLLIIESKHS
jgi:hypothetical protein